MIDFTLFENGTEGDAGKVEFLGVDLDETGSEGFDLVKARGKFEIIKKKVEKGDKKIDEMVEEVKKVKLKGQAGLDQVTEMTGQAKTLKAKLERAVNIYKDPVWELYKGYRNLLSARTKRIDGMISELNRKANNLIRNIRAEKLEEERKAAAKAAALQAKLDKEKAAADKREVAAAKKQKREPIIEDPISVPTPFMPREIKAETDSGRTSSATELVARIENLSSKFILQMVLNYQREKYLAMAEIALKTAIKAGVLGLNGAEGVKVEEDIIYKHRKK